MQHMAARASEPDREGEAVTREMRISQVNIRDYKAIDSLELRLPPPQTVDEPDAFVLGSMNGVGKTSVLEACAIGLMSVAYMVPGSQRIAGRGNTFVRSGARVSHVEVSGQCGGNAYASSIVISRASLNRNIPPERVPFEDHEAPDFFVRRRSDNERLFDINYWLPLLFGMDSDPLIAPPVLLFHSYRKVREGNLAIESMVDADRSTMTHSHEPSDGRGVLGAFKARLIQSMMARSGLFEGGDVEADLVLEQLNGLMLEFAKGRIDKLRPQPDGTYELRVAPVNGSPSYGFDGLSSGQKEIIATLFLIWHMTRKSASVVLIDEPELHLNAEWQRLFVRTLWSLAPWNQYIMATHSEEVFGSVAQDRRILLQPR